MHRYGDCTFCGGEVEGGRAELDYRCKGKLYVFQNVPVGICQQCGEKYLTARLAKEIEHKIHNKEEWDTIVVPVDAFSENAMV